MLVCECFNNNATLSNSLKETLSTTVNCSRKFISFLLVAYISEIIEADHKSVQPSNADEYNPREKLDSAFFIFRLIQGKQDFEVFYKEQLTRRLLLGFMFSKNDNSYNPQLNIPLEKYVILKLKGECGVSFTYKLEGMLKDISTSTNFQRNVSTIGSLTELNIPTSLSILTPNFWPIISDSNVNQRILRHPIFEKDIGSFATTYRTLNPGRHLTFSLKMSICVVNVSLTVNSGYSMLCTLYQAIVLEGFSASQVSQSFSRLEKVSGLSKDDLVDVLESLIQAEIISKEIDSFFIEDSVFVINPFFNSDHKPFVNILSGMYSNSVSTLISQETYSSMSQSKSFAPENIYQIDAAIIWILKKNGTKPQSALLAQVIKAIKFQVEVCNSLYLF